MERVIKDLRRHLQPIWEEWASMPIEDQKRYVLSEETTLCRVYPCRLPRVWLPANKEGSVNSLILVEIQRSKERGEDPNESEYIQDMRDFREWSSMLQTIVQHRDGKWRKHAKHHRLLLALAQVNGDLPIGDPAAMRCPTCRYSVQKVSDLRLTRGPTTKASQTMENTQYLRSLRSLRLENIQCRSCWYEHEEYLPTLDELTGKTRPVRVVHRHRAAQLSTAFAISGKTILDIRRKLGMGRAKFSEVTGLTYPQIRRCETGSGYAHTNDLIAVRALHALAQKTKTSFEYRLSASHPLTESCDDIEQVFIRARKEKDQD